MGSKERAKERREKRLQEISLLRTIPYSDHQRFGFLHQFFWMLLILDFVQLIVQIAIV
jgi:hypothetical protein